MNQAARERTSRQWKPAYFALYESGELAHRAQTAAAMLGDCYLCGWRCGIDRGVELGPCRTGEQALVATAYVHYGEEKPLTIGGGSGAIFFANCDLRCQFCQTARWNIQGSGRPVTASQLAGLMIDLQSKGAVNINFVTPTHVVPQILAALLDAIKGGLHVPLVWNSGGYDSLEALALLDGIIDIYLPDMKYSDVSLGARLSAVHEYPAVNHAAVSEMYRQVGHLTVDEQDRARRGVLVRHLVMPGQQANTEGVLRWIAEFLGPDTYLSLMDQYRPAYRAFANEELAHAMTLGEYAEARQLADTLGLTRLDDSLTL